MRWLAALAILFSVERTEAQALFDGIRAQDFRDEIEETFDKVGYRLRETGQQKCGGTEEFEGYVQCNFNTLRAFRIITFAETGDSDAFLIRLTQSGRGAPVEAFRDPIAMIVRTLDNGISLSRFAGIMSEIDAARTFGNEAQVLGERAAYYWTSSPNGYLVFEARPLP